MNKKQVKVLNAIAAKLPAANHVDGFINRLVGHLKERDGTATRLGKYERHPLPVNHRRRVRRAYLRGGDEAVTRYCYAFINAAAPPAQPNRL